MRVAVVLNQLVTSGGGFQQSLTTAKLLDTLSDSSRAAEISAIFYVQHLESKKALQDHSIRSTLVKRSILDLLVYNIKSSTLLEKIFRFFFPFIFRLGSLNRQIRKDNIDFVFFTSPSSRALEIEDISFCLTVWDLCHLDYPEFPEVRDNGEFERREYFFSKALRKASAIIVESETLRDKLCFYYGASKSRIHVAPFELPPDAKTKEQTDIGKHCPEAPFIFYPAQYWSHKNHVYILDALLELRKLGLVCRAVFCGSDKGHLKVLIEYAQKNGIRDQITFDTFVPREKVEHYYSNCLAVVMPTYFGPSNLPPLEAMHFSKPVFYSDLPELQSIFPGCTVPVDLSRPNDLANKLKLLMNNNQYYQSITDNGHQFLSEQSKNNTYKKTILNIFNQFKIIQRSIKPKD